MFLRRRGNTAQFSSKLKDLLGKKLREWSAASLWGHLLGGSWPKLPRTIAKNRLHVCDTPCHVCGSAIIKYFLYLHLECFQSQFFHCYFTFKWLHDLVLTGFRTWSEIGIIFFFLLSIYISKEYYCQNNLSATQIFVLCHFFLSVIEPHYFHSCISV